MEVTAGRFTINAYSGGSRFYKGHFMDSATLTFGDELGDRTKQIEIEGEQDLLDLLHVLKSIERNLPK